MGKSNMKFAVVIAMMIAITGCDLFSGPDTTGEFRLSSEKFGATIYYVMGYSYEDGEFYRYPDHGDPVPDIINEGYRVIGEDGVSLLPGFNTPGQTNGFALLGEFESMESARSYYKEYGEVESGLQFETISDTVELYQVWIQQTKAGHYVKLLIKQIQTYKEETGTVYNEVVIDYTYQPDGSTKFPD